MTDAQKKEWLCATDMCEDDVFGIGGTYHGDNGRNNYIWFANWVYTFQRWCESVTSRPAWEEQVNI